MFLDIAILLVYRVDTSAECMYVDYLPPVVPEKRPVPVAGLNRLPAAVPPPNVNPVDVPPPN